MWTSFLGCLCVFLLYLWVGERQILNTELTATTPTCNILQRPQSSSRSKPLHHASYRWGPVTAPKVCEINIDSTTNPNTPIHHILDYPPSYFHQQIFAMTRSWIVSGSQILPENVPQLRFGLWPLLSSTRHKKTSKPPWMPSAVPQWCGPVQKAWGDCAVEVF